MTTTQRRRRRLTQLLFLPLIVHVVVFVVVVVDVVDDRHVTIQRSVMLLTRLAVKEIALLAKKMTMHQLK